MGSKARKVSISALELLGIAGFAFLLGWTFVSFFWLFCEFPPNVPTDVRDLTQLSIFIGVAAGLVLIYFLGRRPSFNLFSVPAQALELVSAMLLPLTALLMFNGIHVPLVAVVIVNLITGMAGSAFTLSWLDILSRIRCSSYTLFCGLSFLSGSLLFALSTTSPQELVPIFIIVFLLCSLSLLIYMNANADKNDERADLESVGEPWRFTKELEPSFFMFGIVFALSFVFLFNYGREYVLWGLLAVIPGALFVIIPPLLGKTLSITVMQRIILVITVISCVLLPFAHGFAQIACACLTIAAWGAFKSVNYAFIVKKSVSRRDAPFFRQAPLRISIECFGFAAGWAIAAAVTAFAGVHSDVFTAVRMTMVVLLVVVVMVFFPQTSHHPTDGSEVADRQPESRVVSVHMDETELFERRCKAVVELYQLSPREADILGYLAKGRNAAWIQEELTISPHTVKSHIYNIYRKLDIHSQQKLMSFVEDFPLDLS